MTSPAPPRKPTYRTFVVERHLDVPRDSVWSVLVGLLDAGEIGPAAAGVGVERVLSFEPPWRRAASLQVDGAGLVEHTLAIRDDHTACHLVWSYVVEQPEEEDEAFARLLADLDDALTSACDRVVEAVKAG